MGGVRMLAVAVAAVLTMSACSGSGGGEARPTAAATATATATATPSPTTTSSPSTTGCDAVTTRLLASVQRYIDGYGATLSARPGAGSSSAGDDTELRSTLQKAQTDLVQQKCDLAAFRTDFAAGLEKVTAKGPLARAVLLRLTASMTGTLASTPQAVTVAPGEDLARKIASLAPGATVTLAAGDYVLRQPLVLLAGVTISGVGRERTQISSLAGGTTLLVLNDGRTELRKLTLRHLGTRPASVLVGGPSSSVVLTSARVTGGRTQKSGADASGAGSGVAMTSSSGATTARGTTLQMTRTEISGNAAAGVLATGAHRVSIRNSTFDGNGQCGICFAGTSGGAVHGGTFRGNTVGIAVFDRATPLLRGLSISGGQVGVQATGHAVPAVRAIRVTRTSRAGLIYSQTSNGRVDGATCARTPYGIVLGPQAYPYLGKVSCQLARGK